MLLVLDLFGQVFGLDVELELELLVEAVVLMLDFFKRVVFGLERGDFMALVVDFLVEFLDFLGLEF